MQDPGRPSKKLPGAVLAFGAVSFLNDAASEMVTPLIPVLLTTTLAASPIVVGLIEGVAEATASVLKYVAGRWVDRGTSAPWLIFGGYSLSNVVRPLMGLATAWPLVLGLRFSDRIGKGFRTAPRDAWITSATTAENRGRAFGFHRSMDHLGAFLGPVLAFLLLAWGLELPTVFLVSAIPGAILVGFLAVALVRLGRPAIATRASATDKEALSFRLKAVLVAVGTLAVGAVPDAFLVLWARDAGIQVKWIPLVWAAAHLFRSWVVAVTGSLSDRFGRTRLLLIGWVLRIAGMLLLAWLPLSTLGVWLLFVAFAGVSGSTESVERAVVGDWARSDVKGTSFGWFHMVSGLAALPGALAFGWLWQALSPTSAFIWSACVSTVATLLFGWLIRRDIMQSN